MKSTTQQPFVSSFANAARRPSTAKATKPVAPQPKKPVLTAAGKAPVVETASKSPLFSIYDKPTKASINRASLHAGPAPSKARPTKRRLANGNSLNDSQIQNDVKRSSISGPDFRPKTPVAISRKATKKQFGAEISLNTHSRNPSVDKEKV